MLSCIERERRVIIQYKNEIANSCLMREKITYVQPTSIVFPGTISSDNIFGVVVREHNQVP
jgi:hypothetical protein